MARKRLYCLRCDTVFVSGSLHCPECLDYDSLLEVDDELLRDIRVMKGLKEGRSN